MSLLEDIFLGDEANEAQELERVIEGDEYDERPRDLSNDESDENEGKEDEAEEDKRRVDPNSTKTKRVVKNPRFILNPARLTGPRGIQIIPEHFKDFKFRGKGHEKEDLDMVLKKLEHWAYRLYPKFQFADCLKKIETLGKKRPVMVHLHKIRTDQFMSEETVVQKDSSDEEPQPPQEEDEFDKLLQQQIDLARATPAPGSVKKLDRSDQWAKVLETPNRSLLPMPKATSSPSISDEQKERMLRNRKLAEERRLARVKQATTVIVDSTPPTITEDDENEKQIDDEQKINDNVIFKKHNKSNVIDSDSDEDNVMTVNESIVVDVHNRSDREKGDDKINDDGSKISDHVDYDIGETDKINEVTEVISENDIEQTKTNDHDNNQTRQIEENSDKNDDIDNLANEVNTETNTKSNDISVNSNNKIKVTKDIEPNKNGEEFEEEIMDVDFSDDF